MGGIRSIFMMPWSDKYTEEEEDPIFSKDHELFQRTNAIETLQRYYNVKFIEYFHVDMPVTNTEESCVDLSYKSLIKSPINADEEKLEHLIIQNLKSKPLLVVGQGGFGKTILTKRLAGMWAKGELDKHYDLVLTVSHDEIATPEIFEEMLEVAMLGGLTNAYDIRDDALLGLVVLKNIEVSMKTLPRRVIGFSHAEQTSKWLQEHIIHFCPASSTKPDKKERTLVIIDGWNYLGENGLWHEQLWPLLRYPDEMSFDLLVTTQPIASIGPLRMNQIKLNGFTEAKQRQEFVADYISKIYDYENLSISPKNLIQHAFGQDETFNMLCQSPMYLNYLCFSAKHNRFLDGDDKWKILKTIYQEIFKDRRFQLSHDNFVDGHATPILGSTQILELGRVASVYLPEEIGFQANKPIPTEEYEIFKEWPQCHCIGILHKQFSNGLIECWFPTCEVQEFFAKNFQSHNDCKNEEAHSKGANSSQRLRQQNTVGSLSASDAERLRLVTPTLIRDGDAVVLSKALRDIVFNDNDIRTIKKQPPQVQRAQKLIEIYGEKAISLGPLKQALIDECQLHIVEEMDAYEVTVGVHM